MKLVRFSIATAPHPLVGTPQYQVLAGASVAKITARAEIAQGTFYNYFAPRRYFFGQSLPKLGTELLDFSRARIASEADGLQRKQFMKSTALRMVKVNHVSGNTLTIVCRLSTLPANNKAASCGHEH